MIQGKIAWGEYKFRSPIYPVYFYAVNVGLRLTEAGVDQDFRWVLRGTANSIYFLLSGPICYHLHWLRFKLVQIGGNAVQVSVPKRKGHSFLRPVNPNDKKKNACQ
ncbi:MAG: hypothetical protein M0Z41_07955 [Peptococcaceae bacterium]|nr:hypothetical protein [Peptococcaceae bacterium]